mmetsp:Transcript_15435/g.29328  ORF Transcript_15435/g.29328 Transcript_15435/m.29328 type:complete len:83 (+) Transcript_15435:121-369(+)
MLSSLMMKRPEERAEETAKRRAEEKAGDRAEKIVGAKRDPTAQSRRDRGAQVPTSSADGLQGKEALQGADRPFKALTVMEER